MLGFGRFSRNISRLVRAKSRKLCSVETVETCFARVEHGRAHFCLVEKVKTYPEFGRQGRQKIPKFCRDGRNIPIFGRDSTSTRVG